MKLNKPLINILGIAALLFTIPQVQAKTVSLDNPNIHVTGANYVFPSHDKLHYCRFSETTLNAPLNEMLFNPKKARTNSGIKLRFKTASPFINLTFSPQEGDNRGSEFAVLQNGKISGKYAFKGDAGKTAMLLEITNDYPGQETCFEVVLPSWSNVALTNMEINDKSDLMPFTPKAKPIYLALGNSITHGVGQGSASFLTYPYLLAEKLDADYYNMAVGGAKISPAIARQTAEMPQADIITILIGYNDMMFNDKTVPQYTTAYRAFLTEVRKNQPKATIFCISLTHTRSTGNESTGVAPDDYRQALKSLIEEFKTNGDNNLVFVAGDKITTEANLRQDKLDDLTHFGIEGAALFAEELHHIISSVTTSESSLPGKGEKILVHAKNGQVYVNPGYDQQKMVNIFNLEGIRIASANIDRTTSFRVPSKGIYLVNVTTADFSHQAKILIL
ncbi:hypothetical protein DMA11_05005 [Marinilabiliaceae bacterium JC017]|nr:hypothetical protein DMA11_05005 [Marinilabiliaceae bacterium JC017]